MNLIYAHEIQLLTLFICFNVCVGFITGMAKKHKPCRNCFRECFIFLTCDCCHSSTKPALKQPQFVLKIVQIVFIVLVAIVLESGLFYLTTIHVTWRRKTFPNFDLNRVVLWLSLATTVLMLIFSIKSWKTRVRDPNKQPTCIKCRGVQDMGFRVYTRPSRSKWDLAYIDYVHSFVTASAFLSCAVSMIIDIPNVYEHNIEVAMKLVGFVTDLMLGLLFTKSCVAAYDVYEGPSTCVCDDSRLDEEPNENCAATPSNGYNLSDEEDIHRTLLPQKSRTKQGKTYTMLPS